MKKKNILNLIKYHAEHNEIGFRTEVYEIAREFDQSGDSDLAGYVMSLIADANTFVPRDNMLEDGGFLEHIESHTGMFILPDVIRNDLFGIVNAVSHHMGVNKFLFQGAPGTGKTEAVKHLARLLERDIFMVDFSSIIDSKLGQTNKNLKDMFNEINSFSAPEKIIVLFDEIDAIAMDRTNQNDLREMGRVTSTMLKYMERVDENILMIATTNLYEHFDKALLRRFDSIIDFSRYTRDDLCDVAEKMLNGYLVKYKLANRDIRLFRKILNLYDVIPYPGDLKNVIKSAIAFSNPDDGADYFRRLYTSICKEEPSNLRKLKEQSFTVREIETLTQKSKSGVSKEL